MSLVASSQYLVVRKSEGEFKIKSFQDLDVWKKSHLFVLEIYKMSSSFPQNENYGITSQIRRAAVSVPANIAEGFSRRSSLDKNHFYNISLSSLHEVKYYLILTQDLGYIQSNDLLLKSDEIAKMLNGLVASIKLTYPKKRL